MAISIDQEPGRDQAGSGNPGVAAALKRDGRERAEKTKQSAADGMEDIADALDVAGSHLKDVQPTVASYASQLADGAAHVAQRLREGSIEDLTRDAKDIAARNPALFLLGGLAAGMVMARFMRASSQRVQEG